MSRCIGSEVYFSFTRSYKEVQYEKDLRKFVRRFDWQLLSKIGPSLVILSRPYTHLYLSECFDYWAHDFEFELRLAFMRLDYLQAHTTSNCWPSRRRNGRFNTWDSGLVVRAGGGSLALRSNAFCLSRLPGFHFKASSSSGVGLAHFDVGVCGMHMHIASRVCMHGHECIRFW